MNDHEKATYREGNNKLDIKRWEKAKYLKMIETIYSSESSDSSGDSGMLILKKNIICTSAKPRFDSHLPNK